MIINLNTTVRLALTRFGSEVLHAAFPEHPTDASVAKMPLWKCMQVFGPHLHMGMPHLPFTNIEVT